MTRIVSARPMNIKKRLYSIGHSNHAADVFVHLLIRHGIKTLVDVRSQPVSRFSPQFNRAALERLLEGRAIRYVFEGDSLGGRPAEHEYYDAHGYVRYDAVAESARFQKALAGLEARVESGEQVAVMCAEEDPSGCHRRLLIGPCLTGDGFEMVHIRGNGALDVEADLRPTKALKAIQVGLFDEREDRDWKSARPVRPPARRRSGPLL